MWRGEKTGYFGVHIWIGSVFGKPKKCEKCLSEKEKTYQWANISGKHKRERSDWIRLCRRCHYFFDQDSYINKKVRSDSRSGQKNIQWHKGKWRVIIVINYKKHYLGRFLHIEDAIKERDNFLKGAYYG
jgi:hypothetical protein